MTGPSTAATATTTNPFDLTGSTALVTGAARGLGHAIALDLARAGADVVLGMRDPRAPFPHGGPCRFRRLRLRTSRDSEQSQSWESAHPNDRSDDRPSQD